MVNCIHHWDMGASHKGIVHAKCRKCGAEKDYSSIPVFKSGTFRGKNKKVVPHPTQPQSEQDAILAPLNPTTPSPYQA